MKYLFALFSLLLNGNIQAQTNSLYPVLKTKDSLLFEVGFNNCNISQFEELINEDFEFYHDKSGKILSKTSFIESIKSGICNLDYKASRELINGTLEVYPLAKNGVIYGAVQTGMHQFYAIEKDKLKHITSTAKFTHVWELENNIWTLRRAISYDHTEPQTEHTADYNSLFENKAETEKWLEQKHIPALGIGYIVDGKIVEATVYGKNEKNIPYPENTIFNVASLTKPITATVALKLVNANKWDLDEPLYKYWTDPDIANDPRTKLLTTRHILSHQTGFPNWQEDGKLAFHFAPGTQYSYSGEGFEYLRKALESKFNKPLEQLASELIFEPLGMHDTRFFWTEAVDETRFAKWHKKDGSLYKTYKNKSANAADDLLTTVEDYCKFMVHMMNGAGLNKDLYRQIISKQVQIKQNSYFGLGWIGYENINGNEVVLQHGGDDIGVHTIAFIFPQSKKGLLIFTNSDNGTESYVPAIQHYLGEAGQAIIDIEMK